MKVNAISTGPAPISVSNTSQVEIFGASSQDVAFASGTSGTPKLDAAQRFTGKISRLTASDTLDLANLAHALHTSVGYSGTSAGGTLAVGSGTQTDKIALLGNDMASTFTLHGDGRGGTTVASTRRSLSPHRPSPAATPSPYISAPFYALTCQACHLKGRDSQHGAARQ